MAITQHQRIIFGLKVRQFRQERGWNFEEMSRASGISISYLNEIEKGKKYPQPENQQKLADALGLTQEFLTSPELTKQFAPLGDLLQSNFLNELPLDLFGIELQQVVEIIARAPDQVNAFISALLEIARNYSLRDENFFFAALRAYQELRSNYFEEIEEAADAFVQKNGLPEEGGVSSELLAHLLTVEYGYKIDDRGLERYPELQGMRSVYNPKRQRLLLNSRLNERQRAFQLAKELGFNVLNLTERPLASNFIKVKSFEEALNNYKAAYFAVAILVNQRSFVHDLRAFFDRPTWDGQPLIDMTVKYQASPEVLFQRFNVLTREVGLDKVFFQRFIHDLDRDGFDIDKELHLNRRHQPHASGLNEHYCRRWLSITLLRALGSPPQPPHAGGSSALLTDWEKTGEENDPSFHETRNPTAFSSKQKPEVAPAPPLMGGLEGAPMLASIQRALFLDSGEEYLCIALAKPGFPTRGRNVSVTLGVLLDDHSKNIIRFWDDPAIPRIEVGITCQRCAMVNCAERAALPTVIQKREERKRMQEILKKLTDR